MPWSAKAPEDVRIGGGNALALKRGRAAIFESVGHGDAQPAAPEIQELHGLEQRRDAAGGERQALLPHHVQPDQPQVAHILLHQVRNVVVAHEQHVERHVLPVAHQLILAAAVLEPAARQQLERAVGEPAALLHGDLQARARR
jgi:hypothetical protein